MSLEVKPGLRLFSVVDGATIVVVRAPGGPIELTCAGQPMTADAAAAAAGAAPAGDPILLGKRYVDEAGTIEVLCVKAGVGPLALGEAQLGQAEAKPLPASD